jgi:hypothetical protein
LEIELPCSVERRRYRHDGRCFEQCPTPMGQMLLEHVHGAAARIGAGDKAFPHRAGGYKFLVLSQWTDATNTDACIAWTYAEMQPFVASGR